jgi:NADH-quinone oxidoreductase subunit J
VTAVLFFAFTAVTIGGAFGVILARNPVHSALFLVLSLIAVAGFFLLEDADLVAIVQIIVYASAIVVLFLFVIMLLGVDRRESIEEPNRIQLPAAIGLGLLLVVEVLVLAGRNWVTGAHSTRGALNDPAGGNVHNLASRLFTDFIWPFEITAALLVIAVVGSIVLARRSRQAPDAVAPVPGPGGEVGR